MHSFLMIFNTIREKVYGLVGFLSKNNGVKTDSGETDFRVAWDQFLQSNFDVTPKNMGVHRFKWDICQAQ